jgi:hypothetical protein
MSFVLSKTLYKASIYRKESQNIVCLGIQASPNSKLLTKIGRRRLGRRLMSSGRGCVRCTRCLKSTVKGIEKSRARWLKAISVKPVKRRRSAKERGSFEICKVPSITATLKLLLGIGIGKTRPTCCRVVCLGGLWVVP